MLMIGPCHSQKPASSMTPQGHTAPARPAILLPLLLSHSVGPLSSMVYPGSGGSQIRGMSFLQLPHGVRASLLENPQTLKLTKTWRSH